MSNITAEKVFLAGLIQNPNKLLDYIDYLSAIDFHHAATRTTFESLYSLVINKESSHITKSKLISEAKALGNQNYLSTTKNGDWLDDLFTEKVSEQELDNHFLEVKRQSLKDHYSKEFENMNDYLSSTSDPLSVMIGKVEDAIISQVNILDKGLNAPVQLSKDIWPFIDSLADNPGHLGIDLGYPIWQDRIGQIKNGSVTLVVATAKCGKSQFGLRGAVNAARQGLPVLLLDSELNRDDQRIRLAAAVARVPTEYIQTGFWRMSPSQLKNIGITDEQKIASIQEGARRMNDPELRDRISKLPITYQSISGLDVQSVIPHIRRWILKDVKPDKNAKQAQCLIVYDYLKLATLNELRSNGNIAEWQMHGINVASLHDMMQKYNVPCLAFGQTNNEIDDGIRCVAGGKRISENVTSISYFKRKTPDERAFDSTGTHLMKVFGTRYGTGTGDSHINFDADLSCGVFQELNMSTVNFNTERQKRFEASKKQTNDDHEHE
jgi:replicative DNA helicase